MADAPHHLVITSSTGHPNDTTVTLDGEILQTCIRLDLSLAVNDTHTATITLEGVAVDIDTPVALASD